MNYPKCNKVLKNFKIIRDLSSKMTNDIPEKAKQVYLTVVSSYDLILSQLKINKEITDAENILAFETIIKNNIEKVKYVDELIKEELIKHNKEYVGSQFEFLFLINSSMFETALKTIQAQKEV